jgi:hypothetical protein
MHVIDATNFYSKNFLLDYLLGYIPFGRKDLGEVRRGDMDWVGLAQDRNRWRALVNLVSNLRVQ